MGSNVLIGHNCFAVDGAMLSESIYKHAGIFRIKISIHFIQIVLRLNFQNVTADMT
jgi:hypothetical protein